MDSHRTLKGVHVNNFVELRRSVPRPQVSGSNSQTRTAKSLISWPEPADPALRCLYIYKFEISTKYHVSATLL